MLKFSSAMLPTPSVYHKCDNSNNNSNDNNNAQQFVANGED